MRKSRGWIVLIILISLLVGCSAEASMDPVAVDESVDNCDVCHMGIKDIHASSQIILEDGTPKKFDDIGCMVTYMKENSEPIGKVYVHDYDSGEWIEMENAVFVQDNSISSPMSYGIIAFASGEAAENFQQENGGTLYEGAEIVQVDVKALKAAGHGESHHEESSDSHE